MPDYEEILKDVFISKVLHVPLVQSLNLIAIGKLNDEQIVTLLKFCESTLTSSIFDFIENRKILNQFTKINSDFQIVAYNLLRYPSIF